MRKLIQSVLVVGSFMSLAEAFQGPSYRCTFSPKSELNISFVGKNGSVTDVGSKESELVEWKLPGYRAFLDEPRQQMDIHFATSPRGFFEVREQFNKKNGQTSVELTLLQGNQLLRGGKCRYLGAEVNTVLVESIAAVGKGDSLWVRRAVKGMGSQKLLGSESVSTLVRMMDRYCSWTSAEAGNSAGLEMKRVFQAVNYLPSEAVAQIDEKLSSDSLKRCWRGVLDQIAYEKFPPLQRWVFWANLASQGNQEALRISIRDFLNSPLSREKDMVTFYQSEIRSTLKKLSKSEMERLVSQGLSEKEKKFLEALWKSK
jgi:hypothetical protein